MRLARKPVASPRTRALTPRAAVAPDVACVGQSGVHGVALDLATHDIEERKKAYKEVETIANEMAWLTWLPVRVQKIPVSNRFGNMQPSVLRHRILWNSYNIYVK